MGHKQLDTSLIMRSRKGGRECEDINYFLSALRMRGPPWKESLLSLLNEALKKMQLNLQYESDKSNNITSVWGCLQGSCTQAKLP